jgi:hypothetical protein
LALEFLPGADVPIAAGRSPAVAASLRRLEGRQVAFFRLEGGKHRGAIGPPEGEAMERTVRQWKSLRRPSWPQCGQGAFLGALRR